MSTPVRGVMQAEYGDEAVKQLRQREAEERRAARAAREQGEVDVNQIPLGEKVRIWQQRAQQDVLCCGMPVCYRLIALDSSDRFMQAMPPEGRSLFQLLMCTLAVSARQIWRLRESALMDCYDSQHVEGIEQDTS